MPRSPQTPPSSQAPASQFALLKRWLGRLQNLATYDSLVPNGIHEIKFPSFDGISPIDPSELWFYSKKHDMPAINCFHDLPARIFTVKGTGPRAGCTNMACHLSSPRVQCGFWIPVDLISHNFNQGLKVKVYQLRKYSLPRLRTDEEVDGDFDLQTAINRSLNDISNAHSASAPVDYRRQAAVSVAHAQSSVGEGSSKRLPRPPPPYIRIFSTPPCDVDRPAHSAIIGLKVPPTYQTYHQHAVHLDPMVPWTAATSDICHVTPPLGNVRTVLDLTHEVGVPAKVFWKMFVLCRGCNRIMTGDMLDAHVCNLTNL